MPKAKDNNEVPECSHYSLIHSLNMYLLTVTLYIIQVDNEMNKTHPQVYSLTWGTRQANHELRNIREVMYNSNEQAARKTGQHKGTCR